MANINILTTKQIFYYDSLLDFTIGDVNFDNTLWLDCLLGKHVKYNYSINPNKECYHHLDQFLYIDILRKFNEKLIGDD